MAHGGGGDNAYTGTSRVSAVHRTRSTFRVLSDADAVSADRKLPLHGNNSVK